MINYKIYYIDEVNQNHIVVDYCYSKIDAQLSILLFESDYPGMDFNYKLSSDY